MRETICVTCSRPIYNDIPHICGWTNYQYIGDYYRYKQDQLDERIRASLRDLIDECDSLLDDLDAALDEIDELREDLDLAEGDLKYMLEREDAHQQLEKSLPLVKEYFKNQTLRGALAQQGLEVNKEFESLCSPDRFVYEGNEYVVAPSGCIYKIIHQLGSKICTYSLVAEL